MRALSINVILLLVVAVTWALLRQGSTFTDLSKWATVPSIKLDSVIFQAVHRRLYNNDFKQCIARFNVDAAIITITIIIIIIMGLRSVSASKDVIGDPKHIRAVS